MVARGWWLVLVLTGLVAGLAGCSHQPALEGPSRSIKIIGSNTVEPLSVIWAEEYMSMRPEVKIAVSGPGSGVGIASLIDGTTDIAQSSRDIESLEVEKAKARGIEPHEIEVAIDALSLVVHPSNPVSALTIGQLSAIYTSRVTNWKEVGGRDAPIVALSRDTSSGTHIYFKEHIVQMRGLPTEDKSLEYGPKVLFLPSTKEGVFEVAGNPNAIFYSGLGYITNEVKTLAIKRTASDPAIMPSLETALSGSYAIARPLLYYTNGAPSGVIKDFIDYCLSPRGQERVTEVGYVPLK